MLNILTICQLIKILVEYNVHYFVNNLCMEQIENKILKMPYKENKCISDEDILHLFMGLVKLIKKSANYEALNSMSSKISALEKECCDLKRILKQREDELALLKAKTKAEYFAKI